MKYGRITFAPAMRQHGRITFAQRHIGQILFALTSGKFRNSFMENSFERLSQTLAKLPGLGRRSAERAALALVRKNNGLLESLVDALQTARQDIRMCDRCGGLTSVARNPCRMCSDATRDASLLCVVEDPADIIAIERSGGFHGLYHTLLGKLSPSRISTTEELRLKELIQRIKDGICKEVILALSTDVEGDATASYIAEVLRDAPVRVTRLAFGLPADSGVGYSDPLTLKRALGGRREVCVVEACLRACSGSFLSVGDAQCV